MKKSIKLMIVGLTVAMAISTAAVFAADNTKPAAKPAAKAPVTATAKLKLTQDDATKAALAAHKDAKVLSVQLTGKVYIVKISTASGNRTLNIGGNTGKILKDAADAAPVAAKTATTTTSTQAAAKK
jgi:hypothetical protein